MQYVRSISGSVSKTWNSINPATLSGAIDVIVVEQEDGSLACSPFHVRFGKFSLLRPYEKKVEFRVNDIKQDYSMKLGEGGEAFFVFETADDIPESLQTSPLVSPTTSPQSLPVGIASSSSLKEPDFLDIGTEDKSSQGGGSDQNALDVPMLSRERRAQTELGTITPLTNSLDDRSPHSAADWSAAKYFPERAASIDILPLPANATLDSSTDGQASSSRPVSASPLAVAPPSPSQSPEERTNSPPPLPPQEVVERAISLSKKLSGSNIPTQVTESGDVMLDMTGYKSSEEESLRAEVIARKILAEELEGNYDIGALIGADERGNLWIYSSEEAKEAASRRAGMHDPLAPRPILSGDNASESGYGSDLEQSVDNDDPSGTSQPQISTNAGLVTPPKTPPDSAATAGDPNRNYAKTLRLTSDQLKALNLKPGPNSMSFSVNKATCQAYMYYWAYDVPIVISDIDGTITKSDALGQVLNMIGRDWTHIGVAKLYTDIVSNGYNIMYLTSRSVGQADTTRAYLSGVVQDGFKLPRGPVIMSPDRTIAALRREIYLRKPEVFKMSCLRDILYLFGQIHNPFYAGFGNRLTDALSYRSVNVPSTRIFTINSNAEVSLDLLSLNKYKSSYVTMRDLVDHFFPPTGLLVKGGGEEYTDFNYWRDAPLEINDFSDSESDEKESEVDVDDESLRSGDEGSEVDDEELGDELGESYISRDSIDESGDMEESIMESIEGDDLTESGMFEGEADVQEDAELQDQDILEYEEDSETELEDTTPPARGPFDVADDDVRQKSKSAESLGAVVTDLGNLSLEPDAVQEQRSNDDR